MPSRAGLVRVQDGTAAFDIFLQQDAIFVQDNIVGTKAGDGCSAVGIHVAVHRNMEVEFGDSRPSPRSNTLSRSNADDVGVLKRLVSDGIPKSLQTLVSLLQA